MKKKIFVAVYTPSVKTSNIKKGNDICRTHEVELVYGQCPVCTSIIRTNR